MAERFRVFSLADAPRHTAAPGVWMQAVFGDAVSMGLVELAPRGTVTLHHHPHEQIGIVLRGTQILHVDGHDYELRALDAYVIPGGLPHSGVGGPDGCTVLDVFVPTREEYRKYSVEPALR
jgi:quercetin dioxygenase-like cupin family protein